MKRLLNYADQYLQTCVWKDMALIKFCVFSVGILAGTCIPNKNKALARIAALIVFTVTLIPLLINFFSVITNKNE